MADAASPEVTRAALEIFQEAIDWPLEETARRLAAACGGDAEVEQAVRRLLKAQPGAARAFGTDFSLQDVLDQHAPPPPDRVGVFALTERLARGGMGDVFRGERVDGLFEQTVAVKFIRTDLSADAASWFDAERRILARLRHQNIAAVIDGGATAEGRPYLVMEFVAGLTLDAHLEAHALSRDAALKLFAVVCAAVQFAHQNLVVHADLKPANILVTEDGAPKLTDFGVAAVLTADGEPTPRRSDPVTRSYASPERLAGGPPSVADDVYALGIILSDLLARYPADRDAAAIAAKAAAPIPAERYANVAELADDIARHLTGRPVRARPASGADAALKFARRNPWGVGASLVAVAALVLGLATTSVLYVRAENARRQAETRFTEVRRMAKFMLFDLYDQLEGLAGSAGVRQSVAAQSKGYLEGLAQEADAPKDLKVEAAIGYARLARTQGFGGADNLGEERRAEASYRRAIALLDQAVTADATNVTALTELGWANLDLATLINENPRNGVLLRRATAAFQHALSLQPDASYARLGQFQSQIWAGDWMIWDGQPARGRDAVMEVLRRLRALPDDPRQWERRTEVESLASKVIGDGVYYAGDMAGALPWYRASRRVVETAMKQHRPRPSLLTPLAQSWADEADLEGDLGHRNLAVDDFGVAIGILERVLAFGPNARASTALSHDQIERALNLTALGRAREAVEDVSKAELYWQDRWAHEPQNDTLHIKYVVFLRPAGDVYWAAGQKVRACKAYRQAVAGWAALDRQGKVDALRRRVEIPLATAALRRCSTAAAS